MKWTNVVTAALLCVCLARPGAGTEPLLPSELGEPYRLAEGEVLRLVPPPFAESRLAFIRQMRDDGVVPDRLTLRVNADGTMTDYGSSYGTPDVGSLLRALEFDPAAIEADPSLLATEVKCDVVFQAGTTVAERAAALEAALREQFGLALSVELRTDAQVVVVARGSYELNHLEIKDPASPRVHAFVDRPSADLRHSAGAGTGALGHFLQALGNHLNVTVVDETDVEEAGSDPVVVSWRFDASSHHTLHREKVLELVAAQTGLELEIETRPIEVLYLSAAD